MQIMSEEIPRSTCMDGLPVSEREALRQALSRKLHPTRFTGMSGKMAAIVAFVLGEEWTDPAMVSLSITSDDHVVSDAAFIGDASDLKRNLVALMDAAELDAHERVFLDWLVRAKVDDWRRPGGHG